MAIELDELAGPDSKEGRRLAKYWRDLLDQVSDDKEHKRWVKRGETIEKRYRDERSRIDEEGQRRYNSLWSNVEILYPALYGKCPQPVAERRFRDKDPAGRGAAQILERALRNEIEICGFDESMRQAVRDYLLPGRGTVWVRYEPEIEDGISLPVENKVDVKDAQGWIEKSDSADTEEDQHLRDTGDQIVRESTPVDFIHWQDFRTLPARSRVWGEIIAGAKRVHMTRSQMRKRFGKEIGDAVPLQRDERYKGTGNNVEDHDTDKGVVWEIWSRDDKCVYWVAENYEYLCDRKEDPLKLERFFPFPPPIYANPTSTTLVPVPDYLQYQDQAIQIDELTQRIAVLTKACKVAGVYNAAAKSIQRLFNESVENELIPVDDWAAFAEGGGVEGNISFIPLKEIQGVLQELMLAKKAQIEEMDRLTGITDIMRGTTDARETLGGQRLKNNSSGTRLTHRQNEVARFARDTLRIMADIMAQHFSPQSLIEASGALYEEGLGAPDMPPLTTLNQQMAAPQGGQPPPQLAGSPGPAPSAPPPAQGAGPPMLGGGMPPQATQMPAGAPMGMPPRPTAPLPGAPPAPAPGAPGAPGQNVIPFRPPGVPQSPLNGQILPPMGGPPPIPPGLVEKLKAMQRIASAIRLIRDERLRGFRVDIEVDSTIFGDQQQEKGDRTQFIQSITQYLQVSQMLGAQTPEMIPLLGKILQFGVRGFRVGRDLETAIEDFCDQAPGIAQAHQAAMAKMPNPEMMKFEAEKIKASSAQQTAQLHGQMEQMRAANDMRSSQLDAEATEREAQAEVERQALENEGERANAEADTQQKQIDLQMRMIELQIKLEELKAQKIQAAAKIKQARQEADQTKVEGEIAKDQNEADITLAKHKVAEAKVRPKPSATKK
jgi:hypothetical protein